METTSSPTSGGRARTSVPRETWRVPYRRVSETSNVGPPSYRHLRGSRCGRDASRVKGRECDHPAGNATVRGPLVAAHDHLLPACAGLAEVAPPEVLPRQPDEEEARDRSPRSKPTRDHLPATPGACHWCAHCSDRIRGAAPDWDRSTPYDHICSAFNIIADVTKRRLRDRVAPVRRTRCPQRPSQ
jgi:hypothetical protein